MNILRKIRLSGEYGTALYAVSGVVTLAAAALVVGSPSSISLCVLLKSLSVRLTGTLVNYIQTVVNFIKAFNIFCKQNNLIVNYDSNFTITCVKIANETIKFT